jgi:hypothetical protein
VAFIDIGMAYNINRHEIWNVLQIVDISEGLSDRITFKTNVKAAYS